MKMLSAVHVQTIAEDAGIAAVLLDSDARVKWASPAWIAMMEWPVGTDVRGAHVRELLPPRAAEERLAMIREVFATGAPLQVLGFRAGRLALATARKVPDAAGDPQMLVVLCPVTSRQQYLDYVRNPSIRLALTNWSQCLARLKPRELQVLRMLGLGYTSAEMAKGIHRSIKTIESHRVSLGRKFPQMNRADLVRLAIQSGIVWLDDAEIEEWWSRGMVEGCSMQPHQCRLCSGSVPLAQGPPNSPMTVVADERPRISNRILPVTHLN
jgi:DNA-binding CsgD family transcriptional regulator